MKKLFHPAERGQALVLIVFAAIALFAFTALAIDGSVVFSDRRHAQNAADTSALAAALAKARGNNYTNAALSRALSNGYNNNGTTNVVYVYVCTDALATCTALPPGAHADEYIQVKIDSTVKTYFARVVGWSQITNHVNAVAHVSPSVVKPLFSGQAIVTLGKTDCPGLKASGGGTTTVTGTGIFVNSGGCSTNPAAFDVASNSTISIPCYSVVGTVNPQGTVTTTGPCSNSSNDASKQIVNTSSAYPIPNIAECDPLNRKAPVGNAGTVLNPGYYTGNSFPLVSGAVTLNPGIYCINVSNGFNLTGNTTVTGSNVLIYMINGGVTWNSGDSTASNNLSAIYYTDPNTGIKYPYNGLLLVMAPGNCNSVDIQGSGNTVFTGTILAPCSLVKLAGSSTSGQTTVLNNQIIANNVVVTGGAGLIIHYEEDQQWEPPTTPVIEMNQ